MWICILVVVNTQLGHLLYARFWQKFLFDKGIVAPKDPSLPKKLINQGMITGTSAFVQNLRISYTNFDTEIEESPVSNGL